MAASSVTRRERASGVSPKMRASVSGSFTMTSAIIAVRILRTILKAIMIRHSPANTNFRVLQGVTRPSEGQEVELFLLRPQFPKRKSFMGLYIPRDCQAVSRSQVWAVFGEQLPAGGVRVRRRPGRIKHVNEG